MDTADEGVTLEAEEFQYSAANSAEISKRNYDYRADDPQWHWKCYYCKRDCKDLASDKLFSISCTSSNSCCKIFNSTVKYSTASLILL